MGVLNWLWKGNVVSICWNEVVVVKDLINSRIHTYLLLAQFSVRTVNYGPSFFPPIYGPSAKIDGKKQGSIIYSTDQKNEANKMFITRLLPIWGTGNKCRTRDLTGIWQASRKKFLLAINENNSSQQSVSEKVKTNSPCWKKVYSVKTSGGERQGLGPRNDVLTTCKAVTLRGGQRVIDAFPTLNILIS